MKKLIYALYYPIAIVINNRRSRIIFLLTYGNTTKETIELFKSVQRDLETELVNIRIANDKENKEIRDFLPKIESMVQDPKFNMRISEVLTLETN